MTATYPSRTTSCRADRAAPALPRSVRRDLSTESIIAELRDAVLTRHVIAQAEGILVGRHETSTLGAFTLLRRLAEDRAMSVLDVAEELVREHDDSLPEVRGEDD